jgi:AmpD protein
MNVDGMGWLVADQVRREVSPNYHARQSGESISLLVVHGISLPPGEFGGGYIDRLFLNQISDDDPESVREHAFATVSAHLLIDRSGHIVQYVSFDDCAWHAGVSQFAGREKCNDYSIGIELEGTDDLPYTKQQYRVLADVAHCLMNRYPEISLDRVVGHSDIAPGRKTDPGQAFDWNHFRECVHELNRRSV